MPEPDTGSVLLLPQVRAEIERLTRERDEARAHARDHHIDGGCLTCMAIESERDRASSSRAEELELQRDQALAMLHQAKVWLLEIGFVAQWHAPGSTAQQWCLDKASLIAKVLEGLSSPAASPAQRHHA